VLIGAGFAIAGPAMVGPTDDSASRPGAALSGPLFNVIQMIYLTVSCAVLTLASIFFARIFLKIFFAEFFLKEQWIAGSSPAMAKESKKPNLPFLGVMRRGVGADDFISESRSVRSIVEAISRLIVDEPRPL